jgi:hypothetical protein
MGAAGEGELAVHEPQPWHVGISVGVRVEAGSSLRPGPFVQGVFVRRWLEDYNARNTLGVGRPGDVG